MWTITLLFVAFLKMSDHTGIKLNKFNVLPGCNIGYWLLVNLILVQIFSRPLCQNLSVCHCAVNVGYTKHICGISINDFTNSI